LEPAVFLRTNLQICNEIANTDLQRRGYPAEGYQRNVFFPAFDTTKVVRVQISFFGQSLLRQLCALPVFTDGCAKDSAIIGGH
jgi:hypothetical protein